MTPGRTASQTTPSTTHYPPSTPTPHLSLFFIHGIGVWVRHPGSESQRRALRPLPKNQCCGPSRGTHTPNNFPTPAHFSSPGSGFHRFQVFTILDEHLLDIRLVCRRIPPPAPQKSAVPRGEVFRGYRTRYGAVQRAPRSLRAVFLLLPKRRLPISATSTGAHCGGGG